MWPQICWAMHLCALINGRVLPCPNSLASQRHAADFIVSCVLNLRGPLPGQTSLEMGYSICSTGLLAGRAFVPWVGYSSRWETRWTCRACFPFSKASPFCTLTSSSPQKLWSGRHPMWGESVRQQGAKSSPDPDSALRGLRSVSGRNPGP